MYYRIGAIATAFVGSVLSTTPAAAEAICFIEKQCVAGACDKPVGRPVVVIDKTSAGFVFEYGQYGYTFTPEMTVTLDPPTVNDDAYAFPYTTNGGGRAQFVLGRAQDAASLDNSIRFDGVTFARPANLNGEIVDVVSSGSCMDATYLVLGPGLVGGVVRADEDQRFYSKPENWAGVIAHCKLDARDGEGKPYVDEFWMHPEDPYDPALSCWSHPGSDAMMCLDRQSVKTGALFTDAYSNDGSRLEIEDDGTAAFTWVDFGGPNDTRRVTVTKGTCEKGPQW